MRVETPDFLEAFFFTRSHQPDEVHPMISPRQVHDKNIIIISEAAMTDRPEADGILLTVPGVYASLRFADCAPVMIWGSGGWVMILHSGYKGTVLNIAGHGLELVRSLYGDGEAVRSHAWIGPCIGREHYGRRLGDDWTKRGLDVFHTENFEIDGESASFDLAGEIRAQLIHSGLNDENITLSGIDTFTNSECYSYRRGDNTKRMMLRVKLNRA